MLTLLSDYTTGDVLMIGGHALFLLLAGLRYWVAWIAGWIVVVGLCFNYFGHEDSSSYYLFNTVVYTIICGYGSWYWYKNPRVTLQKTWTNVEDLAVLDDKNIDGQQTDISPQEGKVPWGCAIWLVVWAFSTLFLGTKYYSVLYLGFFVGFVLLAQKEFIGWFALVMTYLLGFGISFGIDMYEGKVIMGIFVAEALLGGALWRRVLNYAHPMMEEEELSDDNG